MKHLSRKSQIKTLIIEDDNAYRTLLLSTLRKAGIQCTLCINGDQAIKKLSQEKFDIIIADYLLPGYNGTEIVKWARDNKIGIPAIVITNFPSEELTNKIKALNRTRLVTKSNFNPLDMPKLIEEMIVS